MKIKLTIDTKRDWCAGFRGHRPGLVLSQTAVLSRVFLFSRDDGESSSLSVNGDSLVWSNRLSSSGPCICPVRAVLNPTSQLHSLRGEHIPPSRHQLQGWDWDSYGRRNIR